MPTAPTVQAARVPPTTEADRRLGPTIARALPRSEEDCPAADAHGDAHELVLVEANASPCQLFQAGGLPIGLWRATVR